MKLFVRDHRDDLKAVMAALAGGVVVVAGETISELAYLPLYVLIAIALAWHRLRRPRGMG
jgi:hypothetical protein